MRLTIIPEDKVIIINNQTLFNIKQDLSWIPDGIHAIQWYDDHGEIEYDDVKTPNEKIKELGIFEQAITDYNNELKRLEEEKIRQQEEYEASIDYWKELKYIKNGLLNNSDWTQLPDVPLTEEKKEEWRIYREQLRQLSDKISDPKPMVLNPKHPDWPILPSK